MGGVKGGIDTSKLQVQQFPGAFGTPDSARIAGNLESLLGGGPEFGFTSAFQQPFQSAVLSPEFGADTASEQALLKSISSLTQGASAARGLDQATPGALAQNLAPALIGLRQQDIQNLSGGLQQEIGLRGQDIGIRGQDIQGLTELIGLAMPQIVAGQQAKGKSGGLEVGGGGAGAAGAAAALCWVAEELFGAFHDKTFYARRYANSADNWFIDLYRKYGKGWANWLKNNKWMKPIVQPIWEYMAFRGREL